MDCSVSSQAFAPCVVDAAAMANLVRVIGVDVGSVRPANSPKFAWAAYDVLADSSSREHSVGDGVEPEGAASAVVSALNASRRVALGLESPLVLPVPDDWRDLARRREGKPRGRGRQERARR